MQNQIISSFREHVVPSPAVTNSQIDSLPQDRNYCSDFHNWPVMSYLPPIEPYRPFQTDPLYQPFRNCLIWDISNEIN